MYPMPLLPEPRKETLMNRFIGGTFALSLLAWNIGSQSLAAETPISRQRVPALSQYLDTTGQGGPAIAADASAAAYLTNAGDTTEVWSIPIRGGSPSQLTYDLSPSYMVSSPTDPRLLLVGGAKDGDETDQLYLVRRGSRGIVNVLSNESSVRHEYPVFSPNGQYVAYSSNRRAGNTFDVHYVRISDGHDILLFQAEAATIARPESWSPDGKQLLISQASSNFNSDLFEVDVATGRTKLLTAHSGDVLYKSAAYDARGKYMYAITDRGRQFTGVAILENGVTRFLTPDRFDVDEFKLLPHTNTIALIRNDHGFGELCMMPNKGGSVRQVRMPQGVVQDLAVDPRGKYLAFDFQSPTNLSEVWRYDVTALRVKALTRADYAGVDRKSFVSPELISYRTFDGRSIPGFYYRSRSCVKRCPVVINIHGGPEGQARPWFDSYSQYLVAHGINVLEPNVRGSTGYGRTYLHLADVRKREDSVRDLHAAHTWLTQNGNADPSRVALFGASYGGYMTLAGLINYPEDWAAGVDMYGPTNWVTFLEKTAPYRRRNREAVYGSLANDRDFLASISPINHVDKIKAPVLIFAGVNDPRVPIEQSRQLADALKARKSAVTFVEFGNEGHAVSNRDNQIKLYGMTTDFLSRYLRLAIGSD